MPTTTYTAIGTITLTGTDSEIEFASIPAAYRDLVIVCQFNSASGNFRGRFNSDTGSNYFMQRMFAYSQGSGSGEFSGTYFEFGDSGGGQTALIIEVMDYSATNKHKTTISKDSSNGSAVFYHVNRWASNTAVNNIKIFPSANTFASGDTFSLYGIVS